MSDDGFITALIAELAKKTSVCWLRYDGRDHAVWHTWTDPGAGAALYLVSGGDEQPLPYIDEVDTVEVVMRSKENGGRLVTWVGDVAVVRPGDETWEPVTTALVSGRLNLDDLSVAKDIWAERSIVVGVTPTGELIEQPGGLGDGSHAAQPPTTPATTRGPLPRILHRRVKRHPRLS